MLKTPLLIVNIKQGGPTTKYPVFGDMEIKVPTWQEASVWENEETPLWSIAQTPGCDMPQWTEWILDDENGETHHICTTLYENGVRVETHIIERTNAN